MARDFCANFKPEGCLGVGLELVNGEFKNVRLWPARPNCLLEKAGVRCSYFEECVMPTKIDISKPRLKAEIEEAVRDYRLAANVPAPSDARKCECGRELEPRKQFCYVCKAKRKKDQTRSAVKKHRKPDLM